MKKSFSVLYFFAVVLLLFVLCGTVMIYKESYLKAWVYKNNYKQSFNKEQTILPLGHMMPDDISFCKNLLSGLKEKEYNVSFLIPKFADNLLDIKKSLSKNCVIENEIDIILPLYKYYIRNDNIIISGNNQNSFEEYLSYNLENCELEVFEFPLIADGNSLLILIDGEEYMVSSWYGKQKYVIQQVKQSRNVCRYDLI